MSVADNFSSCNKKILQDITAASGNIIINKEENPYDILNKSLVMGNIEDTTKPSQNLNAGSSSNIVINKLQKIQNNENTQSARSSLLEDTFHSITENSNDNSVVKDVCIQDTNTSNDNSGQELPENSIDSLNISFDVPTGFSENTILNETYEFNSANNSVGISDSSSQLESNSEVVNNVKETALNLIKDICSESELNVQNIIDTELKNETPIRSCGVDKIKFQNLSKATPTKAITSIIESLEKFHIADTPDKSIKNKSAEYVLNEKSFVISGNEEIQTDKEKEECLSPVQIIFEKDKSYGISANEDNVEIMEDDILNKAEENIMNENSFVITSSQETKVEKIEDKKNPDQITDAIENINEAIEGNKIPDQISDMIEIINETIEDNKISNQIPNVIKIINDEEEVVLDESSFVINRNEDNKYLEKIADIIETVSEATNVLNENSFVISASEKIKITTIEDNKIPDIISDVIKITNEAKEVVLDENSFIINANEENKSLEVTDIMKIVNEAKEVILDENSVVINANEENKSLEVTDVMKIVNEAKEVVLDEKSFVIDANEENKSLEVTDIMKIVNEAKEVILDENSFVINANEENKSLEVTDVMKIVNEAKEAVLVENSVVINANEENKSLEVTDVMKIVNEAKEVVLDENSFVINANEENKSLEVTDVMKIVNEAKEAVLDENSVVINENEENKIEDNKSLEQIADIIETVKEATNVLNENSFVSAENEENKIEGIEDNKTLEQLTDVICSMKEAKEVALDENYFVIAGSEENKNDRIEDNKSLEQIADIINTENDSKEIVSEENSFVIVEKNKIELDIKSLEKLTDVTKTIKNVESEENISQAKKYVNLSTFTETANNEDLERKVTFENVEEKYPETMVTESIEENTKNEDNTLEQVQISTVNENCNILNETITIINETQTENNTFDTNKYEENVFTADSHSKENTSCNMKDIVDIVEKTSTEEPKKTDCEYEESPNKYLEENDTFTTCIGASFDIDDTKIITENLKKSNIFKSIDIFKSLENDVIISKKDSSEFNPENLINEHYNSHEETYGSENISCNTVIENLQNLDISNNTLDSPLLSTININEKKSFEILDSLKSDEIQNELIQETIISEVVNTDNSKILLDSELINIDKNSASTSTDDLKQQSITIEHINLNNIENVQSISEKVIIENNMKESETVQNTTPESMALVEVDEKENIKNSVIIENQELMSEAIKILKNTDIIEEILPEVKENVNDLAIVENKLLSDKSLKENEILQNTNITDNIEKISVLTEINSIVEDKILISNENDSLQLLQDKYNYENAQETNKIMSEYLPLVTDKEEIVQNQADTEVTETDNKVKEKSEDILVEETIMGKCELSNIPNKIMSEYLPLKTNVEEIVQNQTGTEITETDTKVKEESEDILVEETVTGKYELSNIIPNDQELDNAIILPEECLLDDIILLENVNVDFDNIIDDKIIENDENTHRNFVEKPIGVDETIPKSFLTDLVQNIETNLTKESNTENVSLKESLGNVQNDNLLKLEDKKVHSNTDMESIISDAEFQIFMDKYNNKTPQKCIDNIQLKIDCQTETSENNVQSIVDHIIRKDNLTEEVIDLPVADKIDTECALPVVKDQKEFNIELDFENQIKSNENNQANRKENGSFKIPDIPIVSTIKKETLQKDKNLHAKLFKEENKEDTACSSDKNDTNYRTKVLEDFVSKIEDESSNPTDEEQFISGDFFKNPQDFDIFVNITNKLQEKNLGRQSKMSLLVQFDPLFEKRGVSSPVLKEKILSGITRAARMNQSPKSKRPLLEFDSEIKEEENLKQFEDVPFQIESDIKLSDNIKLFEGVESLISELDSNKCQLDKEKISLHKEPENANTKLLNELEQHLTSHNYRDDNDHYDFSNVLLNIEKFVENFKEPISKPDLMTFMKILKKVLLNLQTQYNIETQELLLKIQENGAAIQSHEESRALRAKLEEAENNLESMLSVLSETEMVIVNLMKNLATINNERELAQQHLSNAESAFADVHVKYEKAKKVIEEMKINEHVLKTARDELMHEVQKQIMKFDTLKEHTSEQMEIINKRFNDVHENHETELMKLTTKIRRMELHVQSLELQLQQKSNETAELEQMCDTLTTKLCNRPLS